VQVGKLLVEGTQNMIREAEAQRKQVFLSKKGIFNNKQSSIKKKSSSSLISVGCGRI